MGVWWKTEVPTQNIWGLYYEHQICQNVEKKCTAYQWYWRSAGHCKKMLCWAKLTFFLKFNSFLNFFLITSYINLSGWCVFLYYDLSQEPSKILCFNIIANQVFFLQFNFVFQYFIAFNLLRINIGYHISDLGAQAMMSLPHCFILLSTWALTKTFSLIKFFLSPTRCSWWWHCCFWWCQHISCCEGGAVM